MIHKRPADLLVTQKLLATWRKFSRWLVRVVRRIDVRKPLHATTIGAILAGILAPVIGQVVLNERYRMDEPERLVIEQPSPMLGGKLKYDKEKKANIFNATPEEVENGPSGDSTVVQSGGGKRQLYTATMPDDATKGITIRDNMNKVDVTFRPQLGLLEGRNVGGQVVYPLKDHAGHMVFTPKGNGVKEDIYLESSPGGDKAEFDYELGIPDYIEPKINEDGSIGFFTADQQLFGNISYSTPKDEELVNKARGKATKTYEMFRIPAPTIRQTGKAGNVQARFHLDGKKLGVFVEGLSKGGYPLSIDPTFLLQSTSDFVLGSVDDNIDLSQANQIGRYPLSGGSVAAWTSATALTNGNYDGVLVAYNSALYMIGGGNPDTGTTNLSTTLVYYMLLNSNGTMNGSWTSTSALNLARQGLVGFGFNGYLYAVGGVDSNNSGNVIGNCTSGPYNGQNCTVEYAQIQSNGSVGAWAPTSGLSTAVGYPAGAQYQGILYVMGGGTGAGGLTGLVTTVQSAVVAGDGTISSWSTSSTAMSTATSRAAGGAYNGYVYVAGGFTLPGGTPTVVNTVAYAPIKADGTIGTWSTSVAFPSARRGNGFAVINGHMYVYGGCSSATLPCPNGQYRPDTMYAAINADGTVGQWQQSHDYDASNPRVGIMSAYYNGYIYFVGGCANDVGSSNIKCTNPGLSNGKGSVFSAFDVVGRFDRGVQTIQTTKPYNNNASTTARMNAQGVVLNGFLYSIGGCSTTNCGTATSYSSVVEYAAINADGTLGTFATTAALNAQAGNNAGRFGAAVVAYNDKIYVMGGIEKTTGGADSYRAEVLSSTQNTNGTMGTWATETNNMTAARAFGTAVVWHDKIYYLGGINNTPAAASDIYWSTIASNVPGTWATAKQTGGSTAQTLNRVRWGHSGGIWGNWIYVVGGQSDMTGTYIGTTVATEQLVLNDDGTFASDTDRNITGAFSTRSQGGFVQNGVLYTFGGYTSGSTSSVVTINWSQLNATTGVPGTWSNTNIGNNAATYGLATARGMTSAVSSNGMFYVLGGCSATLASNSFKACGTFVTTANSTEASLTNNGGTGQTAAFATTTALPTVNSVAGRADHASVAYNGYLYILGGCYGYTSGACTNGSNQTDVQAAPINREGTIGSWTSTGMTALPSASSLGGAVAFAGYMYVVQGLANGSPNAASDKVWRAPISSTGTIGTWIDDNTMYLPAARYDFGIAMAGQYIYVVGGYDGTSRKNSVYYTHVNVSQGANGLMEQPTGSGCSAVWCSSTSAVPNITTARSGLSLASYNGKLYVIGGYDGTNALSDIQVGTTSTTDGSVASWGYVTDASRKMMSRQAVAANGYMYFLGNEGSGTDNQYVDINANGTLGPMQLSTGNLAAVHPHGRAALYNGYIYMTGGCTLSSNTCNTIITSGTSEYAGMKSIVRTGHYSKLFTTQVDTAPSQLQIAGSLSGPGSVVTMQFYTASSTQPTFGVAQLISPMILNNFYIVQALDPSGNNVGIALNYLIKITLDDSNSGAFPDVAASAETYVNNVTLYYHANPGRRMRHGKQFTNTGCNDLNPTAGCLLDTAP